MLKVVLILAVVALTKGEWDLDWFDEFDGEAGSSPNGTNWSYDIGGGGWGNDELEYYTSSTNNAMLDGLGYLQITARTDDAWQYQCWYGTCNYTSARLLTSGKFQQAYGRFEASIKLPYGQGTWPAFWMLGNDISYNAWPNCGDIDIVEMKGSDPSTVFGAIQGPGYSGANAIGGFYTNLEGISFSDDFHLYAIEWEADTITWYVDDIAYEIHTAADLNGNTWVFSHEFFILMNFAVGGTFDGVPGPSTLFPQSMTVDYVRVYRQVIV